MKHLIGIVLIFLCINLYSQSSILRFKNYHTGEDCMIENVIPTSDGGKLAFILFDTLCLVKIDRNDQVTWAKTMLLDYNSAYQFDLLEKNSNYYLSFLFDNGMETTALYKFNSSGQLLYYKYIFPVSFAQTHQAPEKKSFIYVTDSNEVLVSNQIEGSVILNKFDRFGNPLFEINIITDTLNLNGQISRSSVLCNDGGAIVASMSGMSNEFIKIDAAGGFKWAKSHSFSSTSITCPGKIIKDFNGNYLISGYTIEIGDNQIPFIMNIDSVGNLIWYKEYSSNTGYDLYSFSDLAQQPNKNILAYFDYTRMLIQTDSLGNVLARRRLGGCQSIHTDSNRVYINNYLESTIITRSISLPNCLLTDSLSFDATRTVTSNTVVSLAYAKIVPYSADVNASVVTYDSHVLIENPCLTTGLNEKSENNQIKVFPNPVTDIINIIDEQNELQNATIEITNSIGQTIISVPFNNSLDVSSFSPGYYFLNITTEKKQVLHSKFIKE